ncbi:MAG: folate-binding protein [Pseudomonadota bacterium]
MNADWQEFLNDCGAQLDTDTGFVQLVGTTQGFDLQTATLLTPLNHLGLIACSGEEAKIFLQNQLTSDVNALAVDNAQYSAWCTPKGRVLASFLVRRSESAYYLRLSADLIAATLKRLQMFVLRSKVKLALVSEEYQLFGLAGANAEAALRAAQLPIPEPAEGSNLNSLRFANGEVTRLDRSRFEIMIRQDAAIACWQALAEHARLAGTETWQWLEVEAGIPLITAINTDSFIPQMLNLEKIGGLSFKKGCYPGQEIVARTQYLGKLKRRLYRFHSEQKVLAGDTLYTTATTLESANSTPNQAEQANATPVAQQVSCGTVLNAAPAPSGGYVALAVVQESAVTAGGPISLAEALAENTKATEATERNLILTLV